MWITKENFRDSMLYDEVFSFLKNHKNVLSVKKVINFWMIIHHDLKLYKHRNYYKTVVLICSLQVNFQVAPLTYCKYLWNIDSILQDRVKERTSSNYNGIPNLNDMRQVAIEVLTEMKCDSQLLFCFLIRSHPSLTRDASRI